MQEKNQPEKKSNSPHPTSPHGGEDRGEGDLIFFRISNIQN
jgi:hypothetical protein